MALDPGPPRRNPSGCLGGTAPQWVRVLGSRPPPGSGSARITRNYPSRIQEGIWVGFGIGFWVIFPGLWRMLGTSCSSISRMPNTSETLDFQDFQESQNVELRFPIFPGFWKKCKLQFQIFPGFWRTLQTSWSIK